MADAQGLVLEQVSGGQVGEGMEARAAGPGRGLCGLLRATHSQEGKNKQGP